MSNHAEKSATGTKVQALRISFAEYIALSAFLMALTALSIDIMLPALPAIAHTFNLAEPNQRQLVVIIYFVGFGVGQLFWGPLSDRFGRLPILTFGLGIFIVASVLALFAPSYETLLLGRSVQGIGSAATRVTIMAIARDLYRGAQMARVISLIMAVFIVVPILAPLLGQVLLYFGPWRLLFAFILAAGIAALLWASMRLPETRPIELRSAEKANLRGELMEFSKQTVSLAYIAASSLLFGCLYAFIANSQQLFGELYGLGDGFVWAFACVGLGMSVSSLLNARIVVRLGMRPVGHWALVLFVISSAFMALVTFYSVPPLSLFLPWLTAVFCFFNLITPNFTALVLEPMGHIAGLANSMLGFFTSLLAALRGGIVGGAYDGSPFPFCLGFFLLSGGALVIVVWAEGQAWLFQR